SFAGLMYPPKYPPSTSTEPDSVRTLPSFPIASRSLWAITKAVLYCTSRSRESCKAECPFAPFAKIAIAERMSRKESLRLAKIVPDVRENWQGQFLQRHIFRFGSAQVSTDPHLGQNASPPLSANRIALKRS